MFAVRLPSKDGSVERTRTILGPVKWESTDGELRDDS